MAFTGRIYTKGEKPHKAFRKHTELYSYLKIGTIINVDPERLLMMIEWEGGSAGTRIQVPITFPYVGPSGCFGPLPEVGARCVCGCYDEGDGKGAPLVLAYLPTGLKQGYQYNQVKELPDAVPTDDQNVTSFRFKPMVTGDLNMISSAGGKISLNKGVFFADHLQDSIIIRPSDQSIISNSINNFMFADGASISMGPAMRNSKVLFDGNGERIEDSLARETTLADGREAVYIVPFGNKIGPDTRYFSEFKVDVDEICDGVLDSNDINGISAVSNRNPIVTLAMGNFISSDLSDPNYGEVLRPVLFSSRTDTEGTFTLVPCVQNNGIDEVTSIGVSFAVYQPQYGGFIGLDKEGHLYMNLPGSSTANPLGAGRSMSILGNGNLKEIWGASPDDGNSWDLTVKGGIRWQVGQHNEVGGGKSIDIRTSGDVYIESGGTKEENVMGNSTISVSGKKTDKVVGEYELSITGLKTETVYGSAEGQYMADYSINTFGKFSETAMAEKQCRFGKRKTSILKGNDELDLALGSLIEDIKIGDRNTKVKTGNIISEIAVGNYTTSVKTGKYGVNVKAGNINLATKAGTARMEAKISATLSALSVVAEGTSVKLGKGVAKSGVVTGAGAAPSHMDYICGVPLKGSVTVTST